MSAPHTADRPRRAARWLGQLRRHAHRRGFVPVAGLSTAADVILPVLPSTSMLVATSLLRPGEWVSTAFWFTVGGVVGGGLLAGALGLWGAPLLETLMGGAGQSARWARASELVQAHGALALFVFALVPWPVRTLLAACALAGLPLLQIVATLFAARLVCFSAVAWTVGRCPGVLERLPPVRRLMAEVRAIPAAGQAKEGGA